MPKSSKSLLNNRDTACVFFFLIAVPLLGVGLWYLLGGLLFPLVLVKIPINFLILESGCQAIAAFDKAERSHMN